MNNENVEMFSKTIRDNKKVKLIDSKIMKITPSMKINIRNNTPSISVTDIDIMKKIDITRNNENSNYNTYIYKDMTTNGTANQRQITVYSNDLYSDIDLITDYFPKKESEPNKIIFEKKEKDGPVPISKKEIRIDFSKDKKTIDMMSFEKDCDPSLIRKYIDTFEKDYKISRIFWRTENKSYDDINDLLEIKDKHQIICNYDEESSPVNIEEFTSMRAALDWYKKLILDSNLSPVERLMYAYDIVKSFKYRESKQDDRDSMEVSKIIKTGDIVCRGYTELLNQLLKEVGIKSEGFSLNHEEGYTDYPHRRNIVRIDDDKYNIHGIFAIDATWDSPHHNKLVVPTSDGYTIKDEKKATEEEKMTSKRLDGIPLYTFFLVPAKDYKKTFPNDTRPGLFKSSINDLPKDFIPTKVHEQIGGLFENDEYTDEVKGYLQAEKPTLDQFTSMLYNVRLNEGYSEEEAIKDINWVVIANNARDKENFFKPKNQLSNMLDEVAVTTEKVAVTK